MKRKPDFLIVGAAKSGTSSLSYYLSHHPAVEIVSNRLEFFGEFGNPAYGKISLEEYLSYFSGVSLDKVAGEKSVSYLYSKDAISEIKKVNPGMKIIMVLRDPVERAYSDYWHRVRTGVENLEFIDALEAERKRIKEGARFELHYASYGLYSEKVKGYMDAFGKDNVAVFTYEDLKSRPENVCRKCFELLGVDASYKISGFDVVNKGGKGDSVILRNLNALAQNKTFVSVVRSIAPAALRKSVTLWMAKSNAKDGYPPMDVATENMLRSFFYDDVKKLESLLGWDLSRWKNNA